ncbi:MAG: HEAT repeat domain-containing protein [Leptospirales bacterium]
MKQIFYVMILLTAWSSAISSSPREGHLAKIKEDMLVGTKEEKIKAIQYCGFSREKSCYYILVKALKDKDPDIRAETAGALGMLRILESIAVLEGALKSEKELNVKLAIIQGIGYSGFHVGASIILPYLQDSEVKLRLVTGRALAKIKAPDSLSTINNAIETEKDDLVRVTCIYASLGINVNHPENIVRLSEYFFDDSVSVRYQAARAAQDLKIKELLARLATAIEIEELPWLKNEFRLAYKLTSND